MMENWDLNALRKEFDAACEEVDEADLQDRVSELMRGRE